MVLFNKTCPKHCIKTELFNSMPLANTEYGPQYINTENVTFTLYIGIKTLEELYFQTNNKTFSTFLYYIFRYFEQVS